MTVNVDEQLAGFRVPCNGQMHPKRVIEIVMNHFEATLEVIYVYGEEYVCEDFFRFLGFEFYCRRDLTAKNVYVVVE